MLNKRFFRNIFAGSLLVISTIVNASDITIEKQWIRESPPNAKALGGFMLLKNSGDKPRDLISASSDAFGKVELHRTVSSGGMMKMVMQPKITIPANGSVLFKPGDYHLMMMMPKKFLQAGEEVDVSLKFKNGENIKITFPVKKMDMANQMNHSNMGKMPMGH